MIPYFETPSIHLGGITIHAFGVLLLLGVNVAMVLSLILAKWRKLPLWPWVVSAIGVPIGAIVVGHLAYVMLYDLDRALRDPTVFLQVWAGISSMGALPVLLMPVVLFAVAHWRRIPEQMDVGAIGVAVASTFIRFGCFLAHDHPGKHTEFFLGVQGICQAQRSYSYAANPACHDLGLYEMLFSMGLVVLLGVASVLKVRPGISAGVALLLYGVFRIALAPLRVDLSMGDLVFGGLVGVVALGALALVAAIGFANAKSAPPEPQPAS